MNLFKPAYYNMKRSCPSARTRCGREEQGQAAEGRVDIDCWKDLSLSLRRRDAGRFIAVGAHQRILRECGNYDMMAIIVSHLDDPALLEDLAIDEDEK